MWARNLAWLAASRGVLESPRRSRCRGRAPQPHRRQALWEHGRPQRGGVPGWRAWWAADSAPLARRIAGAVWQRGHFFAAAVGCRRSSGKGWAGGARHAPRETSVYRPGAATPPDLNTCEL
eukprot:scaffold6986_cov66-Phaeocystis_antarctica.AAC.7